MLARESTFVKVDGKVDVRIPREMHGAIIVSVVGITLPVSRQSQCVWLLIETSIAGQFRGEPAFDVLEHELRKLAVESRTERVLDSVGVNLEGGVFCLGQCRADTTTDQQKLCQAATLRLKKVGHAILPGMQRHGLEIKPDVVV